MKNSLFHFSLILSVLILFAIPLILLPYISLSLFSFVSVGLSLILFFMAHIDSANAKDGTPSHTSDTVIPQNERILIYRARGQTMYILFILSLLFAFFSYGELTILLQTIYTLIAVFLAGIAGKINVSKTMQKRIAEEKRAQLEQAMREESGYHYKK